MHDDALTELTGEPLISLPEQWRSPAMAAELAHARELDAAGPDRYWGWVAEQVRWMRPPSEVRRGGFEDLRYFPDGLINVADNCVDRHAENPERRDRPAIVWEGEPGEVRTVSYGELRDEVGRFANGLRELGVQRGDVVALYIQNLPEAFVAIHACNRIGAIYTVLFAGFSAEAVAVRLRVSGARFVVVAECSYRRGREVALLDTLRAARRQAPDVQATVVVGRTGRTGSARGEGPGIELEPGEVLYSELVARCSPDCECVPLEANEPAFLIFTSGTEAEPKGLVHSVAGFLLGTWANVKWQVGLTDEDVYWCAADVGWLTFPIQSVIGGLAHGGTMVCFEGALDTPTPARFYEIVERHGVTKVLAAPTALRQLRAAGNELAAAHPLPTLRLATVQGEPLEGELFHWASRSLGGGVPVINAYGQTETGSTWTYPVYGVEELKPGSCGRPVPGHRCEVVDAEGTPVPAGQRGQLVLIEPFPTLARTIWNDHERYRRAYFERFPGRYVTSDEAVIDQDGHIWVLGRADDVINVAAHRISTMEIESVVAAHPAVAEAAVVGVSDPVKGTVPIAFVRVLDGAEPGTVADELRERVQTAIGGFARIERVYAVPALPRTRAGKTMRRLLRELGERGEVSGDTTGLDNPDALAAVRDVVNTHR